MKTKKALLLYFWLFVAFTFIPLNQLALALTPFPAQTTDLPPGAMSYGNTGSSNLTDPNIVAAIIGVAGLLIGSAITIVATLLMRNLDIRREDRREEMMVERNRKEKAIQIKQEIYKDFLHELAELETFNYKDLDSFKKDWIKTEVKVDLVASPKIRQAKETVQNELLNIAEKNIKSGTANLSQNYFKYRDALLDTIREDIDIAQ
jgi:hypothetical protein